jgi:hypothetical protein
MAANTRQPENLSDPSTISERPSAKDHMRDDSRASSPPAPTCVSSRSLAARSDSNENSFAHTTQCADVDHQRPLVIDPESPWMGASGGARRATASRPAGSPIGIAILNVAPSNYRSESYAGYATTS